MIYEIVKRDIGWKAMPWLALASAVIWACPYPVSAFLGVMVAIGGLAVTTPMLRATRFHASLPIAGRDLFLARALSIMAIVWLPAMAGAAAAAMLSGHSAVAVRPLTAAALCALAAGLMQSIRVRQPAAPKWTLLTLYMLIPAAGVYLEYHLANVLIPASCALAGIALLVRTWSVVPKSFELAPAKPRAGDGPARPALQTGVASPRFVWLPVLRSVFTVLYSTNLVMLSFFAFGSLRLALCFWVLVVWSIARQYTLWLRPLPIRPRALLIAMVAPILLALAGGYFGGLHLGRDLEPIPALRVQVLDLGALLGWALVVVLVYALVDWRQLSHIPRKVRLSVFVVLMVGATVGGIVSGPRGVDPLHIAVLRLAQALPNSVGVAVSLAAAALATLWWALEKVFAEADCANKPRPQKDEYFA